MAEMKRNDFSPPWMAALVSSPVILSVIYYFIAKQFNNSKMTYFEYLQFTSLILVVVVGGYQVYFWTQRHSDQSKTRIIKSFIDDYIPFWPIWVWIYSFLYYVLIGGLLITIPSIERGVYLIFGGLLLLVGQSLVFYLFPAINPPEWRNFNEDNIHKRFLKYVQAFDQENNCFPSMHCSLATYISLFMTPLMGIYSWVFIILISLSCLFTKQHNILDVIAGVALGAGVFYLVF